MSLQFNEQWYVKEVLAHLRIDSPLTSMSSYDTVLNYFRTLSQVRRDIICRTGKRITPFKRSQLHVDGVLSIAAPKQRNSEQLRASAEITYQFSKPIIQGGASANVHS